MRPPAPGRRSEAAVVAVCTLLGAVVRLWNLGDLGLVHFDEGVYALAGLWVTGRSGLAALDPTVIPYAPGGFPLLVGVAYLILGIGDTAALLVSVLAGIATIPLAGVLGRLAFGPGAGAAAAALAALCGPHVAFSRMALVDATFTAAWLLALGLGGLFLARPGIGRAALLGLGVGLAQNVKYNGILAGVSVAVALAPWLRWPGPGPRLAPWRTLALGVLAFGVAAVVYLPWFGFVQSHGGYQALLDHQRGYFDGLGAWPRNWALQTQQQAALAGRLTGPLSLMALAVPLAALAAWWVAWSERPEPRADVSARPGHRLTHVLVLAVLALVPNAVSLVALGLAPVVLVRGSALARVLAAGTLVFGVMTPLYHPYARLWLPLHATSLVLVGGLIARLHSPSLGSQVAAALVGPRLSRRAMLPLGVLGGLLLVLGFGPSIAVAPLPGLLDGSRSLRAATTAITGRYLASGSLREVRAAVRPAVLFYLATGPTPVRVPLRRVADPASLATRSTPDVLHLLDTALLPAEVVRQPGQFPGPLADLDARAARAGVATTLNLPTLLDLDPSAARGLDAAALDRARTRHLGPVDR